MERLLAALAAFVILVPAAAAVQSTSFGAPGSPVWDEVPAPAGTTGAESSGEPTIGIPWETDHVFYMSNAHIYRIAFDGADPNGTWDVVTPVVLGGVAGDGIFNADPMLHADPVTGRVWGGGLLTACSLMYFSDDDGNTWTQSGNMCGVYGVDHQTIGSGPWRDGQMPRGATYPRATYYCAHGEALSFGVPVFFAASPTACITSLDGGLTWGPPVPWVGGCGSLHGHVMVSPTGFAAVPDADCADTLGGDGADPTQEYAGFAYTADNGLTWLSRTIPGSTAHSGFNNPALDFGLEEGWLWYAQAAADGVHVAMSKDEGATWEPLGSGMANGTSTWLDVGQFHDPPVVAATFPKVTAGDDDRVAVSFIGLEAPEEGELPGAFQCGEDQEDLVWHYYTATSYDAGATWRVQRLTKDPVQVGGVFQGQGGACRNLLDFNDMDIDSQGRLHISFADGCRDECARTAKPDTEGYRTAYATLLRQTTGNGLLAAFDTLPPASVLNETEPGYPVAAPTPEPTPEAEPKESPGVPALLLAALVLAAAGLLRRRHG